MQQHKLILIGLLAMILTGVILSCIAFNPIKEAHSKKIIKQKTGIIDLDKTIDKIIDKDFTQPLQKHLRKHKISTCLINYKKNNKKSNYYDAILLYDLHIKNCKLDKYCKLKIDLNQNSIKVYNENLSKFEDVNTWLNKQKI